MRNSFISHFISPPPRRFCVKHGMAMIGYSSFGSPDLPWGEKLPHLLADPGLKKVADKHGRSVPQVRYSQTALFYLFNVFFCFWALELVTLQI